MRGTFANVRLKNLLVPGVEGGRHPPPADRRGDEHLRRGHAVQPRRARRWSSSAGKEYGSGSSRDWAAKGTHLLGVKAVIAESYERIHRSNLVGMGVLPLQFKAGERRPQSLGLTGEEVFEIAGRGRRAQASSAPARST